MTDHKQRRERERQMFNPDIISESAAGETSPPPWPRGSPSPPGHTSPAQIFAHADTFPPSILLLARPLSKVLTVLSSTACSGGRCSQVCGAPLAPPALIIFLQLELLGICRYRCMPILLSVVPGCQGLLLFIGIGLRS
jgi:hypothetical protein